MEKGSEKKKKILILFTGGTIGSVKVYDEVLGKNIIMQPTEAKEKYGENKNSVSLLLDAFNSQYPMEVIFTKEHAIMEELSENMTLEKWSYLAKCLKKYNFNDYKGVVITHGTDTLGYVANFLAMILADIEVPLVIVSSNYEVTDIRANGVKNLKSAFDFISNVGLPGVYVSYYYNNDSKIIYGSRVRQCMQITDDVNGISSHTPMLPLGKVLNNGEFRVLDRELYCKLTANETRKGYLNEIGKINSNVLIINPYVGNNYSNYNISRVDAVLHTLYHSGTCPCISDSKYGIHAFEKECRKKDIPLYFGPIYGKDNRDIYSSTNGINSDNFIMNTTTENAYVKLILAYHLFKNENDIQRFIYEDVNNEHINNYTRLRKR